MLYTCSQKSDTAQYSTEAVFYHSVGSNDTFRSTNGDRGLYAVNKLNIESQYIDISEKGQRKYVPVRNNDSSHTEVSMQF